MTPKELRLAANKLKEVEPTNFWNMIRGQILKMCQTEDPHRLLSWWPILQTINIGPQPPYLQYEAEAVQSTKFEPVINKILKELPANYQSYKADIYANLVHQAFHLLKFEIATGRDTEGLRCVLEVGAGVGVMRLLFHHLNPDAEYYIYDLPELQLIQRFFTSNVCPGLKNRTGMWNSYPRHENLGLTIACWSLSEIPDIDERNKIMENLDSSSYLFAYQDNHEAVNNQKYFEEFVKKNDKILWHHQNIKHIGPTNHYLTGTR